VPFIISRYFRYGLMRVNCSIKLSTKGEENQASNLCISSHSHLQTLQEALFISLHFLCRGSAQSKNGIFTVVLSYIYSARIIIIHPKDTTLQSSRDVQGSNGLHPELGVSCSCCIKCSLFCFGPS
jgi:hypothetical protein